jgi:hypothetical protein
MREFRRLERSHLWVSRWEGSDSTGTRWIVSSDLPSPGWIGTSLVKSKPSSLYSAVEGVSGVFAGEVGSSEGGRRGIASPVCVGVVSIGGRGIAPSESGRLGSAGVSIDWRGSVDFLSSRGKADDEN